MRVKYFRVLCLVLLIVGVSFNLKVKAYYDFTKEEKVSFSTASYSDLLLTTDRSTYGICNRDATVTLTINNPNGYNVNYTISINDSNLTYTVDGSSSSSYTVTKNGTNTHTIVLKGTTTNTSVSIMVTPTVPYSSSHTKSINLDLVCPVCTWETSSTNSIKNGDTFIYNLSCADASGISTSTLTSNSFTISNSNILSIANITSTSITNGYKYTITTKGGSTNGEAYISLKAGVVFDSNENTNVLSKSPNVKIDNSVVVSFNANGGSTSTISKTVNYKAAYGELPTPTRSGYKFDGWYTSATGGTVVSSTTIVTNSSAHTLYAHWSDIEAPVCTFGSFDKETLSVGETANIKLTCTDNVGVITTSLTSNSFTISNSNAISISNITSASITNGVEYTITVTGGSVTGDSTISLNAGSVKDAAGNGNAAITSASMSTVADQAPPEISFSPNGSSTYSRSQSTVVTVTDDSTITTIKYLWTQTNGTSALNGTTFASGSTITKSTGNGLWYLCVYAKDSYGNEANECSESFALDNTAPTINASSICVLRGSSINISDYVTANDANGIKSLTISSVDTSTAGVKSATVVATDNAGNSTSKSITVYVFTKVFDRGTVTSGSGLYVDAQTGGRYYFRGSSPNNYVSFNGATWRIISLEADGTIKLILDSSLEKVKFHTSSSGLNNFTNMQVYTNTLLNYYNQISSSEKSFIEEHISYSGMVPYGASNSNTILETITAEKSATVSTYISLPMITDYLRSSTNCSESMTWNVLNKSPFTCKDNNWMYYSSTDYWFINAYKVDRARYQNTTGAVSLYTVDPERGVRPTIYLKATTTFVGSGTSSDPYTICTACSSSGVSSTTCSISTSSGYDTSKTLTISASSSVAGYSWDGVTWTSSPSKTISTAGTYNAWIKDSTGRTNSCSINILSRTEYRKASCTAKYGSWNRAATDYIDESEECGQTKTQAENNGSLYYYNCWTPSGGSSLCISHGAGPICLGRDKYTRSCTSINCGEYGAWQADKIWTACGRKVETRTTIGR